jgi:hypothetical protein
MIAEVTSAPKGRVLVDQSRSIYSIHLSTRDIRNFLITVASIVTIMLVFGMGTRLYNGLPAIDASDMSLTALVGLLWIIAGPTILIAPVFLVRRAIRKDLPADVIDAMDADRARGAVLGPLTQIIGIGPGGVATEPERTRAMFGTPQSPVELDMADPEVRDALATLMRVTGARMPGEPETHGGSKVLH